MTEPYLSRRRGNIWNVQNRMFAQVIRAICTLTSLLALTQNPSQTTLTRYREISYRKRCDLGPLLAPKAEEIRYEGL